MKVNTNLNLIKNDMNRLVTYLERKYLYTKFVRMI